MKELKVNKNNKEKRGVLPPYVPPQVIRLDDVQKGAGAKCQVGSSPAGGTCLPTGNGASTENCGRGNGAPAGCFPGNGF